MSDTVPPTVARSRELQDDPAFDRFRSPLARRILVIVTVGLLGALSVLVWHDEMLAAMLVGVAALAGGVSLRRVVRLTADAPDAALDERLIARRDAAYRLAYVVLATGTMLGLLALFIASDAQSIAFAVEARHLHGLFWLFTGMAALLPSAVLAWTEPEI